MNQEVWAEDIGRLPTFRRGFYKFARITYLAIRGFVRDRCMFRSSALAFITVLSLVPLLAVAFSVAKGFGAYDQLRNEVITPFLDSAFSVPSVLEEALPLASGDEEQGESEGESEDPDPEVATGSEGDPTAAGPDGVPARTEGPAVVPSTEVEVVAQEGGQPEISAAAAAESSQVRVAIDKVLEFVQDTDVGKLGIAGVLILLYTVIKLLGSVEQSFNDIWGVRRARTWLRRFSDYISLLVTVPVILLAASTTNTAFNARFSGVMTEKLKLGPVVDMVVPFFTTAAMWVGFMVLYLFMPNTRVKLRSALLGGVVGGTLWQLVQVAHVVFQMGVANYNALYSGLAALPIFLIWVYLSWVTVLLGAEFACAHQMEPAYRQIARAREFTHAHREIVALRVMARVGAAFLGGDRPLRSVELAERLGVPERSVHKCLEALVEAGLLVFTEDDEAEVAPVVPARDLDEIFIQDVLGRPQRPRRAAGPGRARASRRGRRRLAHAVRLPASQPAGGTSACGPFSERMRNALRDQGQNVPATPSE